MKSLRIALPLAFVAGVALAGEVPRYVDETTAAGIDSVYEGDFFYMAGAGVAAFDCSGDGLPELLFAGGTKPAKLYRNRSTTGGPLKFQPVTGSGLNMTSVTGVYPLDIDGDGQVDLAVLRVGENLLMRGKGGCRFERANETWGFKGGDAWTTAFSATWEKGRRWPTLAVGNFMVRDTVIMGYGDCNANELHRPRPDGGYEAPTKLVPGHCALSMLFSDWNRDGVPDLRISNDKEFYPRGGEEQLLRIEADGPRPYGRADGWAPVNIWGMGIASHDVSGDGFPDYYLTNMTENRFEVLENGAARPAFKDRASALGIAAGFPFMGGDTKPSTAWHAEFGDVNNDGLADLLVVKGNVMTVQFVADVDPNNLLIQQPGGSFVEGAEEAGVVDFELGRGGALVDLNADGRLDLIVTNRRAPARIWRNQGGTGTHWLKIGLRQPGGNRDAIGAWIEVRTPAGIQRREHTIGGGHAGGQWGPLHFGLGTAENAEVRVQWPDGPWDAWRRVRSDRLVTLERDKP